MNRLRWQPLSMDLAARVEDVQRFVQSPDHVVGFERGTIESGHFGSCVVSDAEINLLVRGRELDERDLRYRVCFTTASGDEFTLIGYKDIKGARFRMWYDTTRIFVEVYHGRVRTRAERSAATLAGVGVLEIELLVFLRQLPTIRGVARSWRPSLTGYLRFTWFFSKNLAIPYWYGLLRRVRRRQARIDTSLPSEEVIEWARINLSEPVR